MILLSTVHGSHLYGNSHEGSDIDTFEVVSNTIGRKRARYAKQVIKGHEDSLKCDLSTFVQYASKGVPQFLEAMYSRVATVDVLGEAYRFSFRPSIEAIHTYRRTAANFYARGLEENNKKFLRHAHRIAYNGTYVSEGRWFNPTLTFSTWLVINQLVDRHVDPIEFWSL